MKFGVKSTAQVWPHEACGRAQWWIEAHAREAGEWLRWLLNACLLTSGQFPCLTCGRTVQLDLQSCTANYLPHTSASCGRKWISSLLWVWMVCLERGSNNGAAPASPNHSAECNVLHSDFDVPGQVVKRLVRVCSARNRDRRQERRPWTPAAFPGSHTFPSVLRTKGCMCTAPGHDRAASAQCSVARFRV